MTKTRTPGKPKVTGTSLIKVGEHNRYRLEPAESKTHYGERGFSSGGHPYAYRTKRADDAWFVVSELDGKILGLLYQWNDGEWTFSKIISHEQVPRWLASQMHNAVDKTIYNLTTHLISGSTAVEAIAHGLGISVAPSEQKSHARIKREVDEILKGKHSRIDHSERARSPSWREIAEDYKTRARAARAAGGKVKIYPDGSILVLPTEGSEEYFYQDWKADEFRKDIERHNREVLKHVGFEDLVLAQAQNW